MDFPVKQIFLKTLPKKFWTQYLGNYSDLMVQKCIYLYTSIYKKLRLEHYDLLSVPPLFFLNGGGIIKKKKKLIGGG